MNIICFAWNQIQTASNNKFVTFLLVVSDCKKQTMIYWPHSYITLSLYKTDTSLRRTVEAGPEGVRLREVSLYNRYNIESYLSQKQIKILFEVTESTARDFFKKEANHWRR